MEIMDRKRADENDPDRRIVFQPCRVNVRRRLKAGGLLKYIVEPDTFQKLDGKREWFVYDTILHQLYHLRDLQTELSHEYMELQMIKQIMNAKNENSIEEEEEEEPKLTPDMLRPRELDKFPEPGEIHNIQIGLEHGFFGNDASISGNRRGCEGSIDTMFGARGWDGSFVTNVHRSYTLCGVKAVGSTSWFTDSDLVRNTFGKSDNWGKYGIGFIANDRAGKYMARKGAKRRIMDRGIIEVKERGWSLGPVERVEKKEKTVSTMMIGVSSTKTSVKHKFGFITVSYDVR